MSTQHRIWDALGAVGTTHDEDALAAAGRVSCTAVRKYLREWGLLGYVRVNRYGSLGRSVVKLVDGRCPVITRHAPHGNYFYVLDPANPERYSTIDRNRKPPAVNHRTREEL